MKAVIRMLAQRHIPKDLAEYIVCIIKTDVKRQKAYSRVMKDVTNMCVEVRLSQRHHFFGLRKPPSCTESYGFFGDHKGYLQYYTRRVYDVTQVHPTVRVAIDYQMISTNYDYGWRLQFIRMKAPTDDYPKLLMIETDEDISPDAIFDPPVHYDSYSDEDDAPT